MGSVYLAAVRLIVHFDSPGDHHAGPALDGRKQGSDELLPLCLDPPGIRAFPVRESNNIERPEPLPIEDQIPLVFKMFPFVKMREVSGNYQDRRPGGWILRCSSVD